MQTEPSSIREEEMSTEPVITPSGEHRQAKLILSIDSAGTVIQFNAECERLTGVSRVDILGCPFSTLLSPDAVERWETMFASFKQSQQVPVFTLDLWVDSRHLPVLWNGFVIIDSSKTLQSICLLGTLVDAPSSSAAAQIVQNPDISVPKGSSPLPSTPAHAPADSFQVLEDLRKDVRAFGQQLDSLQALLQGFSSMIDTYAANLSELPSELHQSLENLIVKSSPSSLPQPLLKPVKHTVHDPFGLKGREEQLVALTKELDQRKLDLDQREERLQSERSLLDQRLEEFRQWKDKLKEVEREIERRRQGLSSPSDNASEQAESPDSEDYHQLLDKITGSAVIVQRGIIKQVNTAFSSLVGYESTDLIEKSLFDFIADEGLGQVERYYLDRLQGEQTLGYTTVLRTKTEARIAVDVQIKCTRFNGEKAEILLLNAATT